MNSLKPALRKRFKTLRQQMDGREKRKLDDLLLIQFQRLALEEVSTVLTYWPMEKMAEPNTHLFNGWLRHSLPDLRLVYPKMEGDRLTLLAIHEDTVYTTNEWGVTEPKEGEVVDPVELDMILLPLLACNEKGFRLGYGKGYYDRLLAECGDHVLLLGLGYEAPVPDAFEDSWDQPMHYYISPQDIYVFGEE